MRKTKHSGLGHEDTRYSYVVLRRGPRPAQATTSVGRIGKVGTRELMTARANILPDLVIENEREGTQMLHEEHQDASEPEATDESSDISASVLAMSQEQLEGALRQEAYSWPRLVFPPMKRSGHVVLDSCTAEGQSCSMHDRKPGKTDRSHHQVNSCV